MTNHAEGDAAFHAKKLRHELLQLDMIALSACKRKRTTVRTLSQYNNRTISQTNIAHD